MRRTAVSVSDEGEVVQNLSLVKPKCLLDVRRNFFSCRVVDPWNGLPSSVQEAEDVGHFKVKYDAFARGANRRDVDLLFPHIDFVTKGIKPISQIKFINIYYYWTNFRPHPCKNLSGPKLTGHNILTRFTSITISLILQHVEMTFIPKLSTTSTLHTPSFFNGLITSFNIISPTCVFNDILKVLLCRTVCVFICNLCCCCCCCYCCCCCCRVIMNRLIAVFYLLVTVLNLLRYMIST